MSYEIPGFRFTLPANADLSGSQFCAVKAVAASGGVQGNNGAACALPAAGGAILGINQGKPLAGQDSEIMTLGVSKALLSGAVTVGALLMVDAAGKFLAATATNQAVAEALMAGAAGDIVSVLLMPAGKQ